MPRVRFNPTRGLRIADHRDPAEERETRALTRVELIQLLDHVPERWRLLFEFLAHSGLRISEAIGLTWADVEFEERPRVRVHRSVRPTLSFRSSHVAGDLLTSYRSSAACADGP